MPGGISGSIAAVPKSGSVTPASRARPVVVVMPRSWPARRLRRRRRRTARDDNVLVHPDVDPRADLSVRPGDADAGGGRGAESHMDGPELTTGMPAPNGQLPMDRRVADGSVDPGADRVDVRLRLRRTDPDPVAHRDRRGGRPGADVAPDPGRITRVRLDEVEQAVAVEVHERGASAAREAKEPRGLRDGRPERP